jgi:hypothetical protein
MKKFIATISISISAVFAIALANAQDSTMTPPQDTTNLPADESGTVSP